MPPHQKHRARTHSESRAAVCALCFSSGPTSSLQKVTATIESKIQDTVHPDYSLAKDHLPTSICSSCRLKLSKKNTNIPYLPYNKLEAPRASTRGNPTEKCLCSVCKIAGTFSISDKKVVFSIFSATDPSPVVVKSSTKKVPQCRKCFTYIRRGKAHKCIRRTRQKNLAGMVKASSMRTKGRVTSDCLKSVFQDCGVKLRGGTANLPTGSKPISVTIGANQKSFNKTRFSAENLIKLQTAFNLSDRTTLGIAGAMRVVNGRNSVEPNIQSKLVERNHRYDDLFEIKTLEMKQKVKKGEENNNKDLDQSGCRTVFRTGVVCSDPDRLVQTKIAEEGLNVHKALVKVGLDGGQGMLKVAATVEEFDKENFEPDKKFSYKNGPVFKQFKDGSVKKLVPLAVFPNVSETYYNVKIILDQMDVEEIEYTVSADIKMLLMLIGKPEGKPKFNCPFCDGSAPFIEPSTLYSFGDLTFWHEKYVEAGCPKKNRKSYQNYVNKPLVTGPHESLILERLNILSLHILIGVVDKLISAFEEELFDNRIEGEEWMDEYLKQESIVRKKNQGGHALEGNQSRKLLKRVDYLELKLKQENNKMLLEGLPYIAAFRAFDKVVHACFGMELDPEYKEHIAKFSQLYRELGISVTPKVHILERHVAEFLQLKGELSGLGFWMEQAMESVHHDFKVFWERYKVDCDHPQFGPKLKSALSAYCARHM